MLCCLRKAQSLAECHVHDALGDAVLHGARGQHLAPLRQLMQQLKALLHARRIALVSE